MKKIFNEMSIVEKVQFICVFLPILCTIGWVINRVGGESEILSFVVEVLLVVGLVAELVCVVITDIVGGFKFLISFLLKGWSIGMSICPFFPMCFATAVIGFAISATLLLILCTMLPVAVTVYFYFFRRTE